MSVVQSFCELFFFLLIESPEYYICSLAWLIKSQVCVCVCVCVRVRVFVCVLVCVFVCAVV